MKQFLIILEFELRNYYKRKSFIIFSLFLVIIMAAFLFSPRYIPLIQGMFEDDNAVRETTTLMVNGDIEIDDSYINNLNIYLESESIVAIKTDYTIDEMKNKIGTEDITRGLYINGDNSYVNVVEDIDIYDNASQTIHSIMTINYQNQQLQKYGIDMQDASSIISPEINVEYISTGVNQAESFLYTYILIFMLYIGVITYGQFVVSSIVTEKTSRAMEVLVTSAKPSSFIFAKVIGTGIAGIAQMLLILLSAFIFYNMNIEFWQNNPIVISIFNIPLEMIAYMMIFFVLGLFIYAFLFGAAGSLAARIEDMGTLITPITLLFIISFFITSFSLNGGNIDSTLMYVSSFIPFTSPMAMFSRIAMSVVPPIEIIISIIILIVSTIIIGIVAAKIYCYGVFFYGNKPSIIKTIKYLIKNGN